MNLLIVGYGKMGKTIERMASEHGFISMSTVSDLDELSEIVKGEINYHCAVEFSKPDAAVQNLKILAKAGIPTVCGTTGWLDAWNEVTEYYTACGTPFFYASNFSVGMNIMFQLNRQLARLTERLHGFELSVSETHHIQKLDAPSGTAKTLLDDMVQMRSDYDSWSLTPCSEREIAVIAHREGEVKGLHEVTAESSLEKISLRHEALDRRVFAQGALLAAIYIADKKGIHDMEDMLQIG